jgi:cytochrome P450
MSQIQAILDSKIDDSDKMADHPTIFHELLSSNVPQAEKSFDRLVDEGETMVGAGTIPSALVLASTSFHILANPEVLHKLKTELTSAIPDPGTLSLQKLEQLPYLSAVVTEGLRISNSLSARLPRASPDSPITFREWQIPPGTPVSMTPLFIHDDPRIFPEPREFRPDRWLQGSSKEGSDRYFLPFAKGTRACLGINLAYAELYLPLAAMFRQFDMELYETTREDVDVVHDFFDGFPRLDSKGVRVLVK